MKKNLKILYTQLCVLAIGCFIGEAVFGLPKWLGLVIAGLMFYLVFFIIQIKGAMSNIKDEVSSDGIAGARICGVFISAILLAFILGIYVYQAANIAMTIAGVVLLILQRRKIKGFFFENRWENNFWLVYFGIAFIICGIFSVFACLDIAPCTELCGVYRAIGIIVMIFVIGCAIMEITTWFIDSYVMFYIGIIIVIVGIIGMIIQGKFKKVIEFIIEYF